MTEYKRKSWKPTLQQRIANLKCSLPPAIFYYDELPGLVLKRDRGWHTTNALCPFHNDHRPGTFNINLDSGAFRCFSCGAAGGDILAFYRLRYCCDFMTALRDLEGRAGL